MCQLRKVLLAGMLVTLLSVSMASATVVISDTFSLTAERTEGSLLVGQTTEVGGVQWLGETSTSYYRYTLTSEGQVARTGPSNAHQDRVAGVPYTVNPAGEVITISADMTWTDSTSNAATNANSVGFMPYNAPWDGTMVMASRASLSVYMYATGRWIITAYDPVTGSQSNFLDSSTSSEYSNTDAITPGLNGDPVTKSLKLSYDTVNNAFSLWLDDVQLVDSLNLSDKLPAAGAEWAPDISYGAFYMRNNGQLNDNRCDNFLIESTNPIPEPMTLALLLAGGGVLFARKRK